MMAGIMILLPEIGQALTDLPVRAHRKGKGQKLTPFFFIAALRRAFYGKVNVSHLY
jgi:hypothetical protein